MPLAELSSIRLNFFQLPAAAVARQPDTEIVMIHGLATSMAFWYAQIAQMFTAVGRVTLYDLRGHGYSDMPGVGYSTAVMANDLRELLDHLGLERVHLVAHSFGGSVAIAFAAVYPDRVESLILADVRLRAVQRRLTLGSWPHWPKLRERLLRAGIELDENDPEAGIGILTAFARLQVRNPERAMLLQKMVFGVNGRLSGRRTAMRWLRMLETTSAATDLTEDVELGPAQLSALQQPILAIFGEQSMSLGSARALERHCAGCTLRIVRNAGHFFPLTRPQALIRPGLRFIDRHALPPAAGRAGLLPAPA